MQDDSAQFDQARVLGRAERLVRTLARLVRKARRRALDGDAPASATSPQPLYPPEAKPRPVQSLQITFVPNDKAEISIDQDQPFIIPATLARFLQFLAEGDTGPDGVVAFRTISDAIRELCPGPGASGEKRHVIHNWKTRLRKELADNRWDPRLVETRVAGNKGVPTQLRFRTRQLVVIQAKKIESDGIVIDREKPVSGSSS